MNIHELGELLRSERERHGLTQEDVAQQTKISIYNIRAIEDGRKEALPHPVYAKGFVKNYARMLGLDENELAEVMDKEHRVEEDDFGESPAMEKPVSMPAKASGVKKSKLPVLLLLVLLLAVLAGLMWYSTMGRQTDEPDISIQEQPAETPQSMPEAVEPENTVAPPPPAEPETEAVQEPAINTTVEEPAAMNATQEQEAEIQTENETAAAEAAVEEQQPEPAAEPEAPVAAAGEGYVATITATELCWVYGKMDNATATDFTLRPGQTKSIEFEESLSLKLGNAGGVKIFLNGQEYDFEAESGEVKTLVLP